MSSFETDGLYGSSADAIASDGAYDVSSVTGRTTIQVLITEQNLPGRITSSAQLQTEKFGKVKFESFDRISVDDVFLHLVRRELYRLAGGTPPGDDINQKFVDFLIRENFVIR
jgi:hypothetical protein